MRRWLIALGAAFATALPVPAGAAPVAVVVIDGRGYGHGVGMAQDGALAMGRKGTTTAAILAQFYPGTKMGRATGELRVALLGPTTDAVALSFPNGGEIRDARSGGQSAGFPVRLPPGGQVRIRFAGGRYRVEGPGGGRLASPASPAPAQGGLAVAGPQPGLEPAAAAVPPEVAPTTTTSTPPPLITLPDPAKVLPLPTPPSLLPPVVTPPSGPPPPPTTAAPPADRSSPRPLWAVPSGGGTVEVPARKQRYRGVIEATGGELRLVNHVDVEQYLRGMGEVRDPGWPAAGLRAQAIAARTYALRAMGGGGELCDTQRCQVYLGATAEYGAMDKAVSATAGQVVTFGGRLASTVYSANGGGFSASPEEGFGTPGAGYPYLRPAAYPTGDPLNWTVRVSLRDVGRRLGYPGRVDGARATSVGPSGRVLQVTLDGARGPKSVPGLEFDRALGLKSTFFTLRTEVADAPPPPPPPGEGPVQLLPEELGAGGDGAVVTEVAPGAEVAAPAPPAAASGADVLAAARDRSSDTRLRLGAVAWMGLLSVLLGLRATRGGLGPKRPPRR